MHARVHQLASAIAALAAQGEMDSARTRMSELFEARDELIGQLRALIGKKRAAGDD
jgi:hypothetical protein